MAIAATFGVGSSRWRAWRAGSRRLDFKRIEKLKVSICNLRESTTSVTSDERHIPHNSDGGNLFIDRMRVLFFARKKNPPDLGAVSIKLNDSVAIFLKQGAEPLLVHLRFASVPVPHGLCNPRADFSDYLNRQEEFRIICVIKELKDAPITAVSLTGLRDNVSVEKISHAIALPHVEQVVVVEVRHRCENLLQRTFCRLAK